MRPPAAHQATTAQLQALYPFLMQQGLGDEGTYIGRDRFGGSFCYDPWALYRRGVLTNPNVVVIGQLGRGKSALVKSFLWRQLIFGRHAWVVDPKGEYGPLAEACGAAPIRIAPYGPWRLNPLDPPPAPGAAADDRPARGATAVIRRQSELLCTLAAASLGRDLQPAERTAADLALRAVAARTAAPTLPQIVSALLEPDRASAASVRTDVAGLAADGRPVALELRRLVQGDLAGMFDAPTTPGIRLDGSVVVLDLSALYGSGALGILMTCATAWLQSVLCGGDGVKRLVVVDEAWAILSNLAIARWLQATFKLSRSFGIVNIAVVHRLSDLRAAGGDGSEQQRLAEGLLADSETRIVFGQSSAEAESAAGLLGLTSTEQRILIGLPRGVALWKVANRSFVVEHRLGAGEIHLVDTDRAMSSRQGSR